MKCPTCKGTGGISLVPNAAARLTCDDCNGTGKQGKERVMAELDYPTDANKKPEWREEAELIMEDLSLSDRIHEAHISQLLEQALTALDEAEKRWCEEFKKRGHETAKLERDKVTLYERIAELEAQLREQEGSES